MKLVITLITIVFLVSIPTSQAENLKKVVSLQGTWKFTIGDDTNWSKPTFNDKHWDEVFAPCRWEDQGYVGYDGFAWYRKKFSIPETSFTSSLVLYLGMIDDANEVYFNGVLIGQTGKMPPKFETAYNINLAYPIPVELINLSGENTLAIRVYDAMNDGGIVAGPLFIGYDLNNQLLALNLSGVWKFSTKNYKNCREESYNDAGWKRIRVPATWESQGWNNYDGFAWYRKTFELPAELTSEKLYLVLGRIDDKEKVYLNGKQIGDYKDVYHSPFGNNYRGEWQMRRAYRIPKDLLHADKPNTLAVLVYDEYGQGGVYDGPVGIMTKENYESYVAENQEEDEYFNPMGIIGSILNDIFGF